MGLTNLIPSVSVGGMRFNDDISKYVDFEHTFYSRGTDFDDDLYVFVSPPLSVYVSDKGKITSICCRKECFYNGVNLIGLGIDNFIMLSNERPDKFEKNYILVEDREQNQTVYDFDSLALQIWTWRKKIVTVFCSNYDEED